MKNIVLVSCIFIVLGSCTAGRRGKIFAYGKSRSITCYSGERKIYEGHSKGKIASEANSDGYYFTERDTGKLIEVSGNCVIGK